MPILSRLSRRVTLGFVIAMVLTLTLAWTAVTFLIRPMIVSEKQKTLNDNQQVIFAYLDARLAEVQLLGNSMASVMMASESNKDLPESLLPILLLSRQGDFVAGGGFWPAHTPGQTGVPLFWGFVEGEFKQVRGYENDPLGYWNHPWYTVVSARKGQKDVTCHWSPAYTDPYTQMRMITCSLGAYSADGQFLGVITIDVALEHIRQSLNEFAQRRDGYALVFDDQHRVVAYPDSQFERFTQKECDCPQIDSVVRTENSWLLPVFEALEGIPEGRRMTRVSLLEDPVLSEPSAMYLYHYFPLNWDMGFAIPVRAEEGVADVLLKQIMMILVVSLTVMWFIALIYSRDFSRQVHETILNMREQIRGGGKPLSAAQAGEIGELQVAINEYATALHNARKKVEVYKATNEELERFASAAAHDMRAPLVMINSHLHLLQKRIKHRLADEELALLQNAFRGVIRADTILNDLLAYARSGGVRPETPPFQSRLALDEALLFLQGEIEKTATCIDVQSGEWPIVSGRLDDLMRVFQNLITNAIKYGADTPQITIEWQDSVKQGFVRFSVTDNGVGIEPKLLAWIFEPFTRSPNAKENQEGTGIGLAICHKIITRYGGSIQCQSEGLMRGCRFVFDWPVPEEQGTQERA